MCRVYQLAECNSFIESKKVQGLFMFRKKVGRHKRPVPESVRNEIVELYRKYRFSASYIGKILRAKGYNVDNNRINQVLKEVGFAMSEAKK